MEQDIRLLTMDWDIGGRTLSDRVWWCSNILIVSIFLAGLRGIGLDGLEEMSMRSSLAVEWSYRFLAQIGVRHREL